jgi:hypothetical protein
MVMEGLGSSRGPSVVRAQGTGPPLVDVPSPAASRASRPRWRDPRLVLGLALIAGCSLLGARTLAAADDTVDVWAARHALKAGQPLAADDVVRHQVRFGGQVDADRYLSADGDLPAGVTVDRPVGVGELVPRSAIGGADARSVTEVPLSVGTDAVPATIGAGSSVDVWVTPQAPASTPRGGGSAARRSTLVFDDVRVVSAPVAGSALGPTATRQVIVGIPADQQARLPRSIAALGSGDVLLTAQR